MVWCGIFFAWLPHALSTLHQFTPASASEPVRLGSPHWMRDLAKHRCAFLVQMAAEYALGACSLRSQWIFHRYQGLRNVLTRTGSASPNVARTKYP